MKPKTRITTVAAFAALALGAGNARADLCIGLNTFNTELVGRNFVIPARGQCATWAGFTAGSAVPAGNVVPSVGGGCTTSDGKTFLATFLIANPFNQGRSSNDSVSIDLTARAPWPGHLYETQIGQGDDEYNDGPYEADLTVGYCRGIPTP